MAPRKSTSTPSSLQFPLEFKADDDAWYAVRLVLHGKTLTIKYEHFSADYDDVFKADEFMNLDDIESFGRRFRKVSLQLQDNECNKVVECMTVCASHAFAEDDLRFYDAIVEKVQHKEHSFESGEEECLCNFILNWQHGPNVGNLISATVENVCLIQHTTGIDPKVASFLKKSWDKIEMASINSIS